MFSRHSNVRLSLLLACCLLPLCAGVQAQAPEASDVASLHARKVPAWTDDAVVYEIFPRQFSPQGTLQAVTAQLDRLHRLGVNVLWIMPVHPVGQVKKIGTLGSPYAPRDYYAIDPALGTDDDFRQLVQAAHSRGMRVILDMVADHTSWDSPMMAHPEFYNQDAAGRITSPHGWNDVAGLNYNNPALRKYMIAMFVYWLKTFQLDGFRCDAAAYIPTSFWNELRPAMDAVKPDVLMLAEASKPELMTQAFDLDYAWPLMGSFNEVLEDGHPAATVRDTWKRQAELFPQGTEHLLISDDHDERRAIVRYGERGALAASALVFTLPGVPLLYNGNEVGDATPSGAPALFEKFTIDWGAAGQEGQFPAFYRALLALHHTSPALRHGSLTWLHNSDEGHVLSFLRQSDDDVELIAVDLSNTPFRGTVEAATPAGKHWVEQPLQAAATTHDLAGETATVALPSLSLDAFGVRIFRLAPALP